MKVRLIDQPESQPGSALPWGGRGPGFKSRRPDELKTIGISFRSKVLAYFGGVLGIGSSLRKSERDLEMFQIGHKSRIGY